MRTSSRILPCALAASALLSCYDATPDVPETLAVQEDKQASVAVVPRPVTGFADLHVHQFTEDALGSGWLYGSATGPMSTALARCNGNLSDLTPYTQGLGRNHGTADKALLSAIFPPAGLFICNEMDRMGGDSGLHADRRHGYCQKSELPGPGICQGNLACNLLSSDKCSDTPCEWRSIGSACRDKPGDGISSGVACNLVGQSKCESGCYWDKWICRGNLACNTLKKSQCKSNVCEWRSLGSVCRDRDGDGKSVGLACNTLGQSQCAASCSFDPNWGSITLHQENHLHDFTDRHPNGKDKASWPAWDSVAHQQVYVDWLRQAYDGGLRLMVMSALNNESFCKFLPKKNRKYDCDDMSNVLRQLDHAKALDNDPAYPWYQIAYSAAEARSIINENKMAVVLSVEASDIFNGADPQATLQSLYNAGVRTLQPLHQFNSALGGVAWHEKTIKLTQMWKNLPSLHHLCKDQAGTGSYAKCDASTGDLSTNSGSLNFLGLTDEGKSFVRKMLNLGMPVDLAHVSERGIKDVEPIVGAACNYPVYVSHGHVRTLLSNDSWKAQKSHEKTVPDWVLGLIKSTGGMMGLRTGSDYYVASDYQGALAAKGLTTDLPTASAVLMNGDPSEAGGNELHFGYALDYLHRVAGVQVAFGSDLNGLIPQMVFRFEDQDSKMAGLAHIGKLPTVLTKLETAGVDAGSLQALRQDSAEAYLRMWERAEAFSQGTGCCPPVTVGAVMPNAGFRGRALAITVLGTGFTPHANTRVTLSQGTTTVDCTDVKVSSSTELVCTVPVLAQTGWYRVMVFNRVCGVSAAKETAFYAAPYDGPHSAAVPPDPPFAQADLMTVLADPLPNGWYQPNPDKINAVDWTHPAWDGIELPSRFVPADRPLEDGTAQQDWNALTSSPERPLLSPLLDFATSKEDFASMRDPVSMLAACDQDDTEKARLAVVLGWPSDWRAQLDSLCDWRNNTCAQGTFTCPGGASVPRVGQITDATTGSCPFDLAATYATCPESDNLAMGAPAIASAPAAGGEATKAVDNNVNGAWSGGGVAQINSLGGAGYWQVDLGSSATIHALSLFNRTDCCGDRLKQFYIQTSTDGVNWSHRFQQVPAVGSTANIVLDVPATARYVRLEFSGMTDYVNLAEVKVWGVRLAAPFGGGNLALGKSATLSTAYYSCTAANAVNGNLQGTTTTTSSCTTACSGNAPGSWWQVDLGLPAVLTAVRIWNRQDCVLVGCIDRLRRFEIQTSNDGATWTTQISHPGTLFTLNQKAETLVLPPGITARYVRVKLDAAYQTFLQMNEVEVYGFVH